MFDKYVVKLLQESSLDFLGHKQADPDTERQCFDDKDFNECLSVCHSPVLLIAPITKPTISVIGSRLRWRTQTSSPSLVSSPFAL